ncbi:VOC family protein [Flavobacterium sp. ENC]|uniref:VOC family protein n=1 Tax=Flavobacterium sp. ENC TaxID=2897330 RepID=UPI001E653F5A|nr:VOC family protein [Flavobacterium sp. ENC]MCD0466058.1 VOC family protein [Flavobacterium sp. ENC]
MKFSNIRLLVNNFDNCFTFYNDILGLECNWGKPGENYASFTVGGTSVLALFKQELMSSAITNGKPGENEILQDKIAIIIQVDNVDETYITLQNKGVIFLTEPKDMNAWGIRVTHFRDPENNLFELYSDLP